MNLIKLNYNVKMYKAEQDPVVRTRVKFNPELGETLNCYFFIKKHGQSF